MVSFLVFLALTLHNTLTGNVFSEKNQSSKSMKPLTLMACFVDCSDGRSWANRDV